MKKEDELEIPNTETSHIEIDVTDLGTFLGRIARCITKEGTSLEALADKWLDIGEIQTAFKQMGIEMSIWGEQLQTLKNKLCQTCKLRQVSIFVSFDDSDEPEKARDN